MLTFLIICCFVVIFLMGYLADDYYLVKEVVVNVAITLSVGTLMFAISYYLTIRDFCTKIIINNNSVSMLKKNKIITTLKWDEIIEVGTFNLSQKMDLASLEKAKKYIYLSSKHTCLNEIKNMLTNKSINKDMIIVKYDEGIFEHIKSISTTKGININVGEQEIKYATE